MPYLSTNMQRDCARANRVISSNMLAKNDGDVKFTTGETTSTIPRMLYVPQSMHNTLANVNQDYVTINSIWTDQIK